MNNVIATAFEEGKAKGVAEGFAEGKAKGFLKTILEFRFDRVEEDQLQKINSASLDQLNRWTAKAKTARSIDEVLG